MPTALPLPPLLAALLRLLRPFRRSGILRLSWGRGSTCPELAEWIRRPRRNAVRDLPVQAAPVPSIPRGEPAPACPGLDPGDAIRGGDPAAASTPGSPMPPRPPHIPAAGSLHKQRRHPTPFTPNPSNRSPTPVASKIRQKSTPPRERASPATSIARPVRSVEEHPATRAEPAAPLPRPGRLFLPRLAREPPSAQPSAKPSTRSCSFSWGRGLG